ncbi:hypothetical protein [Halorubrum ezzemoulense]|uniref:Uncharacterized protein n=1 Tax=Halorubrum ezzemoulense TaxID=337243 RepID=A0A256JFU9_HALEZ|nr:hypothetical protein [Halorubrum ezzemoulense]OYR67396.1 hypothetical protein DJ78_15860 [Halorubrum ezzemoulense]
MAHDDEPDELEEAGIERINERDGVYTGVYHGSEEQARDAIPSGWREVHIEGTMDGDVQVAVAPI